MTIGAIYKTLFIASLIVGVFSQAQYKLANVVPKVRLEEAPKEAASLEKAVLTEAEKLEEEQAANAMYKFSANVDDGIMGSMQSRTEERIGHNVVGSYGYSDGFIRQLITYSAGKDGYKILSVETDELGVGPQENPEGKVHVRTSVDGQDVEYSITKADIGKYKGPSEEARAA